MERFRRELGFYACTVSSFEQYTLARFMSEGYFEKHLSRMKKRYRAQRNELIALLRQEPLGRRLRILEKDAGLHFLLEVETDLSDRALTQGLLDRGVRVRCLSDYYHGAGPRPEHCLVVNYTGATRDQALLLRRALEQVLGE